MNRIKKLYWMSEKMVKTTSVGIVIWIFVLAFMLWIFQPITGYLKPMLNEEGVLIGMEYEHVTWWGLRHETLNTEVKSGSVYYEKNGRWHPVEKNLFTPNVME